MTKKVLGIILLALAGPGCATHIAKPAGLPQPPQVKFGEFQQVEMKGVGLGPDYASDDSNQEARQKVDELLQIGLKSIFPNLKRVARKAEFTSGVERTLCIIPLIKEIKFIGTAARFWAGALAGNSAILMQVKFQDSSTGKTIAEPEFYHEANAWAGSWTIGATDRIMLEDIVQEITDYIKKN